MIVDSDLETIVLEGGNEGAEAEIDGARDLVINGGELVDQDHGTGTSDVVYVADVDYGKSGGYQNKAPCHNFINPAGFNWSDLGKGLYGMFVPHTQQEYLNTMLRSDVAQLFRTHVHETLHKITGEASEYVIRTKEAFITGATVAIDRYMRSNQKQEELKPAGR